eukprot:NODE_449_length_1471_cov_253.333333_g332_i0.p1 GENE.NODE_449_length_1471_cov_253.333333_g332_i0~~NODE_449_length_1471_cov_253.333333_g332_i0.p1  ORF type:complete len:424 (+),score=100.72 NODE_449_length_1471_cov_253.333333_g332_i0:24-1274(+)
MGSFGRSTSSPMVLGSRSLFTDVLDACSSGDIPRLERLRAQFLDDEQNFEKCTDEEGNTALHACIHKGTAALEWCLKKLAPYSTRAINVTNLLGKTPVHLAVKLNLVDCLTVLLRAGADPNVPNNVGSAALHTAAACGALECVQVLLSQPNVDVNMRDVLGNTALHKCVFSGSVRVADMLIDKGAKLNEKNNEGLTALGVAVRAGQVQFVQHLLKHGADCNVLDNKGNTVLHYCAARCFRELLTLLLTHGADVNGQNNDMNTPLHIAAQNFRQDVKDWELLVLDLVRAGADAKKRNGHNKVASDYVHRSVISLFSVDEVRKRDDLAKQQAATLEAQRKAEHDRFEQEMEARRVRRREEEERHKREEQIRRAEEERMRRKMEEERLQREEEERIRLAAELEARKKKKKKKKKDETAP